MILVQYLITLVILSIACYADDKNNCLDDNTRSIAEREGYQYKKETGHCYKFHNIANTWWQALGTCVRENAYLAIINSQEEANIIKIIFLQEISNTINSEHNEYAHIGFIDWEHNKRWHSLDGKPLGHSGYLIWADGEPNSGNSNTEHCGSVYIDGRLNDIRCYQRATFICEKVC